MVSQDILYISFRESGHYFASLAEEPSKYFEVEGRFLPILFISVILDQMSKYYVISFRNKYFFANPNSSTKNKYERKQRE